MAQFDTYGCDRCKRDIRRKHGEKPTHITKTYRGDAESELDLCADCDASFSYFMENVKQFDELAEKIATKEPIQA